MKKIILICIFAFGFALQWHNGDLNVSADMPEVLAWGSEGGDDDWGDDDWDDWDDWDWDDDWGWGDDNDDDHKCVICGASTDRGSICWDCQTGEGDDSGHGDDNCYWCGENPCVCHNENNDDDNCCYLCGADPCVCFDDSGDDGGGDGTGNPIESTPNVDPIYHPNSTLTPSQKQALEKAMKTFINKCPTFLALYNALVSNGISLKFSIKPTIASYAAYQNGNIYFKNENDIACAFLQEELIHALQHYYYGSAMVNTVRNYEFEAKVFQDLACMLHTASCAMLGAMDQDYMFEYSKWMTDFRENQYRMSTQVARFMSFCSKWTGYPGTHDDFFVPLILLSFFNNSSTPMKPTIAPLLFTLTSLSVYSQTSEKFNYVLDSFSGSHYVITLKSEKPVSKEARSVFIYNWEQFGFDTIHTSIVEKSLPPNKYQKLKELRVGVGIITYSLEGKVLSISIYIKKEYIDILNEDDLYILYKNLKEREVDLSEALVEYPANWVQGTEPVWIMTFPLSGLPD